MPSEAFLLTDGIFQDKAASDISIQVLKQWFERQNRVHTARILVGFDLHIGFKVCAACRRGVWCSHTRGR
ncbi:TPA: hypothetical protein ACFU14_000983 [Neisseria cinerea]